MLVDAVLQIIVYIERRRRLLDMVENFIGVILSGLVDDPVALVDFCEIFQYKRLSDNFADQL